MRARLLVLLLLFGATPPLAGADTGLSVFPTTDCVFHFDPTTHYVVTAQHALYEPSYARAGEVLLRRSDHAIAAVVYQAPNLIGFVPASDGPPGFRVDAEELVVAVGGTAAETDGRTYENVVVVFEPSPATCRPTVTVDGEKAAYNSALGPHVRLGPVDPSNNRDPGNLLRVGHRGCPGLRVWAFADEDGNGVFDGESAGVGTVTRLEIHFNYDRPDHLVEGSMLGEPHWYDPDVLHVDDGVWLTWLEFSPDTGDHIWVGRRNDGVWTLSEQVTLEPGRYARPTLTRDAGGTLWLSYEASAGDLAHPNWDVFICERKGEVGFGPGVRVSGGPGNDINHRIAAAPDGSLRAVWQSDRNGQFDIMATRIDSSGAGLTARLPEVVSTSPLGDWHPAVVVAPDGAVWVAWDTYDGESFNVVFRRHFNTRWEPTFVVGEGPTFQGRVQLACDSVGNVWALYEEGALNWGKPYKGPWWKGATDAYGPVHRLRKLHLFSLHPDGSRRRPHQPLPMPTLDLAQRRGNTRAGTKEMGVFYERGHLTFDRHGRLWVTYRHYFDPHLATDNELDGQAHTHIESGWQLYARCLDGDGWSPLFAFDVYQRDGMQRLSVTPSGDGITAVWSTGRTDRNHDRMPKGVALASAAYAPRRVAGTIDVTKAGDPHRASDETLVAPQPAATTLGGTTYHLFYGDLHRHTDISLCQPFLDGSLDDAYRYAIEAANLAFLGITDHTHDLDLGDDPLQQWSRKPSHIWWRSTKEVTRHQLDRSFCPYFAYERSHDDTDHNFISLGDEKPHTHFGPLDAIWERLDHNTITIPHTPGVGPLWDISDEKKRPLLEIYQGYRDVDYQWNAHNGLRKGHRFGFIASSDHLSTMAAYACVWAPEPERESIFRSLQSRRTFAATDKIRLIFRTGDHWMGEVVVTDGNPEFQIEIDGTGPIQWIELYKNGRPLDDVQFEPGATVVRSTYGPVLDEDPYDGTVGYYVYIHVVQIDGNQAWSSPIWIKRGGP